MRSISRQLSGGLLLVMLITVLLVGQGAVWLFDRALRDYLGSDLQRESDALLAAMTATPDGLILDTTRIGPDYLRPFSGRYFIIESHPQRWRSRSLWDERLPGVTGAEQNNRLVPGPAGQQLLMRSEHFRRAGRPVSITVALDYQPLLVAFERARNWLWGLGGIAVLASLSLQHALLRRGLKPLHAVRTELAEWQAGMRLELSEDVPLELLPLVQEINLLGAQVEQIIQRSRKGLGDFSHALKTPLAVAESLLNRGSLEAEDRAQLQRQLQDIRRQLERALHRSRLAPESHSIQRFDPAEDLPWLLSSLQQIHGAGLQIHHPPLATGRPWPFEREDILELLGNLLDNACKWSAGNVQLDWALSAETLLLRVEDDGPGISEQHRQLVLGRGERLDESVAGHGLGLAIVGDMVEVYGGNLELLDSDLGGLAVQVSLPVIRRLA